MAVRNGRNSDGKMHWFHAFLCSVLAGYAGATFTALWMGRPTSMLSNDLNMAFCIIAFAIANYSPYDIGYRLGNTMPVVIITTVFAQLFRAMGLVKFCQIAHEEFKSNPSPYYPVPVFGPILLPTLLGNFGGFFSNGFDGHLEKGMPWPFQNGLFCSIFYHFFIHDEEGFIGVTLRKVVGGLPSLFGLDDHTFAVLLISTFMQVVPLLQLKYFLGPSFSPFNAIPLAFEKVVAVIPAAETKPGAGFPTTDSVPTPDQDGPASTVKKRRRRRTGDIAPSTVSKEKDL